MKTCHSSLLSLQRNWFSYFLNCESTWEIMPKFSFSMVLVIWYLAFFLMVPHLGLGYLPAPFRVNMWKKKKKSVREMFPICWLLWYKLSPRRALRASNFRERKDTDFISIENLNEDIQKLSLGFMKGKLAAVAAKSLQSCLTLCDPTDGSPPGSPVPGILQARRCSGLPFPSPMHESEKWNWSRSVVSDS